MTDIHDLVIVGGGPGGLTAGIYAMRAAMKTILVEKGVHGGQIAMTEDVENYPGIIRATGAELAGMFHEHAASYGLEMISDEVVAVEPGLTHHTVRLANGQSLAAHAVILSTGGSSRKLGVPGEEEYYGRGVSYCAVCDGFFYRNKTVLVVGGGDTAAEEALYLAKIGKKVYMAHRRDALRASRILQQRIQAECKIEMLWNTVVGEIIGTDGAVSGATLRDTVTGETRSLAVDGVFVFVGFTPNNALVPAGTKMNAGGYVVTDDKCQTATPGIFAVGDLKEKYARQIVVAAGEGATAALAAAHYVEGKKASEACGLPPELA